MSDNDGEAAQAASPQVKRQKRQNTVQTDVAVEAARIAIDKLKSEGKLKPNRHGLPAQPRYDMFECIEHRVTERKRKNNNSGARVSTGRAMVNVATGHTDNGYAKYLTYHVSVRAEGRSLADATKNEQLSHLCNKQRSCVRSAFTHSCGGRSYQPASQRLLWLAALRRLRRNAQTLQTHSGVCSHYALHLHKVWRA